MNYYIGIDLGGTNIKAGIVDENGKIVHSAKKKTNIPRKAEEIMDDMASLCFDCAKEAGIDFSCIKSIGIGTPGTVDTARGVVIYSANLYFENICMKEYLQNIFKTEVYLANDADAAAVSEYIFGAGKGTESMIAITLGTGVGSGVIIDGKIISGERYCGGEIGHTVIKMGGRACNCGRLGCFEAYASASGLIKTTVEFLKENKDTSMWSEVTSLDDVSGRLAYDHAKKGDKTAIAVVNQYQEELGCGLANIINVFQPDVICLSGGVANEREYLLAPLKKIVESQTYDKENHTQIKIASGGYDSGIVGAAFLWKMKQQGTTLKGEQQ